MSEDMDGPGSSHFIAPDMDDLLDRAKQAAMNHYVTHVEKDKVPPTQRAMYVLKALDAERVLNGDRVPTLEAEAAKSGVTVQALAQTITDMANQGRALELQRMTVNNELREAFESSATDPTPILEVLNKYGIDLT